MVRNEQTKELLAADPVSYVLFGVGRLTLGWDGEEDKFLVKLNNVKHEELEKFVQYVQICRQKIVNTIENGIRQSLFFLLYGIQSVVVQA